MTIDGRARVLSAITLALADGAGRALSEPAPMALATAGADRPALARAFSAELAALGGMATVVRDRADCASVLTRYLQERNVKHLAVQSTPRALNLGSLLHAFDVAPARERSKLELESVECGLLDGQALLADTGSAIVVLDSAEDRVLPYLPRTCVIVSDMSALHATLTDDALAGMNDAARTGARGEALIITGPSRSADIEKTLVLGAHGPEAVAVFIIEQL